jgi:uncharacterized surface protein with fasciclin (FAS1) repeats
MNTRASTIAAAVALALAGTALPGALALATPTQKTITVGGAPMYPSRNIVQNAVNSKDHTTLVAAVKAAGLVETLQGPGPFTVFAPVNRAFERLPEGTVPTLLRPENKATLAGVLAYHVVAGRYSAADLKAMVERTGGRAALKTVQGGTLWIAEAGRNRLQITDAKGDVATITIADVNQSNGVIHVIDTVLLPS